MSNSGGYDPVTMTQQGGDAPRSGGGGGGGGLRAFLVCAGILSVIGAIVAIAGTMTGFSLSSSSSSSSSYSLTEIPPNLATACSKTAIASPNGYEECEEICSVAACCRLPANDHFSCLLTHEDECMVYNAACDKLDPSGAAVGSSSAIPKAPANLASICDPGRVDGLALCTNACVRAECCYTTDPDENCYFDHAECDAYSPCMVLTDSASTIKTANDPNADENDKLHASVLAKCSGAALSMDGGIKACLEICSAAACCFADGSSPDWVPTTEKFCLPDKADFCDVYAPCAGLEDAIKIDKKQDQVKLIQDACSDDSDLPSCTALCQPGECCFESGDDSCFNAGVDVDCHDYLPCAKLHLPDDDASSPSVPLSDTKAMVDAACSFDTPVPGAESACMAMCRVGECCFMTGSENCLNTGKDINCHDYVSCDNLPNGWVYEDETNADLSSKHDKAAEDEGHDATVDEACKPAAMSTLESLTACHELCEPYLCCFSSDSDENCYADHPYQCDVHESCDILVRPWHYVEFSGPTPGTVTKELVDEACDSQSLKTKDGIAACHAVCAPKLCCFAADGMKSNCEDTMGSQVCDMFASCATLVADDDAATAPKDLSGGDGDYDVNEVCTDEKAETDVGRMKCAYICSKRSCCFVAGPGNCYPTDMDWCDEYSACEALEEYDEDDMMDVDFD